MSHTYHRDQGVQFYALPRAARCRSVASVRLGNPLLVAVARRVSEPVATFVRCVLGGTKEAIKYARTTDIRAPAGVPRRRRANARRARFVVVRSRPVLLRTSVACPMSVGLRRPARARRVDVDHALASVRPAMARPSALRGSGAQIAVHVEVPVPAFQHVFDASGGGTSGLRPPWSRAFARTCGAHPDRPPAVRRRTWASPHRCRLRSPGEDVAHQRLCRASVPVFERVDLHETVVQSAGRSFDRSPIHRLVYRALAVLLRSAATALR